MKIKNLIALIIGIIITITFNSFFTGKLDLRLLLMLLFGSAMGHFIAYFFSKNKRVNDISK